MATMFADLTGDGGVDANVLTLYYSVILSLWSVVFLSVWKRSEAEHKFLWGTEGFELAQPPRKSFKGVTIVNEETHREEIAYDRSFTAGLTRLVTKVFSTAVILGSMGTTAGLAL